MRKIYLLVILSLSISAPLMIQDDAEYRCLKIQYPELRYEWYQKIVMECNKYKIYKITPGDICAIIENEGHWLPNIINKGNKDGSWDFGLMQINSKHVDKTNTNPSLGMIFLDPKKNIEKGVYEYNECLIKTHGNKYEANRLYNAGRNNKRENYTNWKYVEKIDKARKAYETKQKDFFETR